MKLQEKDMMIHSIKSDYFEGWYARIQCNTYSIAVIFGISSEQANPHAFIQTLDSVTQQSQYVRFSLMDVIVQNNPFQIRMKQNVLSMYGMKLDIFEGTVNIKGRVLFSHLKPLKRTLYAPTVMGPFAYIPHMDCVHSIISMHHQVSGAMSINDVTYPIEQGIGYMEKDRGSSFPKQYVWMQGMNEAGDSFVLAVADVPIGRGSFQGVLGCLKLGNQMIRFGSYFGALAKVRIKEECMVITLYQGATRLFIRVVQQDAKSLKAPSKGAMSAEIKESLDSTIEMIIRYKGKRYTKTFFHCASEICEALTKTI